MNKPEPMLLHSVYKVECLCGEMLVTAGTVVTCAKCRREIRIDWQARYESPRVMSAADRGRSVADPPA